jgi:hypothetical protein
VPEKAAREMTVQLKERRRKKGGGWTRLRWFERRKEEI